MNSLTTFQIVSMIISFLAGLLANAKQTGKFFGIVTEPSAWVPYVAIAAAFLPAFGSSLQQAGAITAGSILAAIIAGISSLNALPALGAGVIVHHVFVAHKLAFKPAANDNGTKAASAKPAA